MITPEKEKIERQKAGGVKGEVGDAQRDVGKDAEQVDDHNRVERPDTTKKRSRFSDPDFDPFLGSPSEKRKRQSSDQDWSSLRTKASVEEEDEADEDYNPNQEVTDDEDPKDTDVLAGPLPHAPDLLHLVIRVAREQPWMTEDRVVQMAQQRYEFELYRLERERDAATGRPAPTRSRRVAGDRAGLGEVGRYGIYEDPATEPVPNAIIEAPVEDDEENWLDFPGTPTIR